MHESSSLIFYTVTNQTYFPGTVATLSSIRSFYRGNPIYVVAESRALLTSEQVRHLKSLEGVHYIPAAEIPIGHIREAWQMKAHAAFHLSSKYDGVLVQMDSDAVLCGPIDDLAAEAIKREVPVGGKDGGGANYPYSEYAPYVGLCDAQMPAKKHFNPHYVSTSVLVLPLRAMRQVLRIWSAAVDKAHFGPGPIKEKLYAGYSDQGVFNAILYFKGIVPHLIDNEILSEHWCHGRSPVNFRDGRFWKGQKQQIAFHSVGNVSKFWMADYRDQVSKRKNLESTYLYWLFHLFDGPCGLLNTLSADRLVKLQRALFPSSSPDLLKEYFERRRPVLFRVMQDYGRPFYRNGDLLLHSAKSSQNLLCTAVFIGRFDARSDVHPFYSAVKRLQNYRMLGGTSDLVILTDHATILHCLNPILAGLMRRYRIGLVQVTPHAIRRLFSDRGICIEAVRLEATSALDRGRKEGRYAEALRSNHNLVKAMEIGLGRFLLVNEITQKFGYERCAVVDAEGDRYQFLESDIPTGRHVDEIWKFDEFTDLIFEERTTDSGESHHVTNRGLRQIFDLRREEEGFPMFQVSLRWLQGTRAAWRYFVDHFANEIVRQCALGFYPADELVATAVLHRRAFWPPVGATVTQNLKGQLDLTGGVTFPVPQPFYLRRGEEKYGRRFHPVPPLDGRYAISISGFNLPGTKRYSKAALSRAKAYRDALCGRMDVHIYTNDRELCSEPQLVVHRCTAEELTTWWDARATQQNLVEIHYEAAADPRRHKTNSFIKRPELAQGMISKLMAVERTLGMNYDGVLSADADGDQFSLETIDCLRRRHIDGIWHALRHHPMLCYIVGTAANDSFHTRLSVLCEISGLPENNEGPFDWIWGPCWMIEATFARRFFHYARATFNKILDRRIAFHDEHLLNCTYNLAAFDDDPLRGVRDLGDAAAIGYREFNPKSLLRYKRWVSGARHNGRVFRDKALYEMPEFEYRR